MTTTTVTREQIGDRIAAARRLQRWDQADLAEALRSWTDDETWTRFKVSKIERGKLIVPSEQLHVFAMIQGQDISWYFSTDPYNAAATSVNGRIPR